ncbi:Sel1 domain protein repeat-containing protein [Allochromatium vinosum DSM 180]|uniref:Sel1 domain protein repeat-containing protein n=2 Tax=Allochromatium vinosum TaxID=1049 RepID=D3RU80_ALLVD|nr:Sel1 domain protein repeat-containing protein [Allochromatium vinosum DSM 180]
MGLLALGLILGALLWVEFNQSRLDEPARFDTAAAPQRLPSRIATPRVHGEPQHDNPQVHHAAESGDAGAQYQFGMNLVQNAWQHSEPLAMIEAVDWIRKAAEQEHVNAQLMLGALYEKGRGLIQDYELAYDWYRRAAQQGNALAMERLGLMFARGRGVEQDLEQAYVWLNLAAARGDHDAEGERNKIHGLLSAAELTHAQERSRTLDLELPRLTGTLQTLPFGF